MFEAYLVGCPLLEKATNCSGLVTDGSRWLQNGGKAHFPPKLEPGRGTCSSCAQTCLGKGVSRLARRHQRTPVKRYKRRCERTHVKAHRRKHKNETQKGDTWREMWGDIFGETKLRRCRKGDIVWDMAADALMKEGGTTLRGLGLWATRFGTGTPLRDYSCGWPMLEQGHLWGTVAHGWVTLELRAVTSEEEKCEEQGVTAETIMHCHWAPALPIALSMRLGRTEIEVMKMRPEETRNGEEGCWAEVEPEEGARKVISFGV